MGITHDMRTCATCRVPLRLCMFDGAEESCRMCSGHYRAKPVQAPRRSGPRPGRTLMLDAGALRKARDLAHAILAESGYAMSPGEIAWIMGKTDGFVVNAVALHAALASDLRFRPAALDGPTPGWTVRAYLDPITGATVQPGDRL